MQLSLRSTSQSFFLFLVPLSTLSPVRVSLFSRYLAPHKCIMRHFDDQCCVHGHASILGMHNSSQPIFPPLSFTLTFSLLHLFLLCHRYFARNDRIYTIFEFLLTKISWRYFVNCENCEFKYGGNFSSFFFFFYLSIHSFHRK